MDLPFLHRRPAWRHPDPTVRRQAVNDLRDPAILATVAREDPEEDVRLAAVAVLDDLETLDRLAEGDGAVAAAAARQADRLRLDRLCQEEDAADLLPLVAALRLEESLVHGATAALAPEIRLACAQRVQDPERLVAIGRQQCGKVVARFLVERLAGTPFLARLAQEGGSSYCRNLARQGAGDDGEEEAAAIDSSLEEIVANAWRLVNNRNLELAAARLDALAEEFRRLDPETTHPLWQRFTEAQEAFADFRRHRLARLAAEEEARQARARLFDQAAQYLEDLQRLANRGQEAFESRIAELENQPFFQQLPGIFDSELAALVARYEEQRPRALEEEGRYQPLLEEARRLAATDDPQTLRRLLPDLSRRFRRQGFAVVDTGELEDILSDCLQRLRQVTREERQQRAAARQAALDQAEELCRRLEALTGEGDAGAAARQAREIEAVWRELALDDSPAAAAVGRRYRRARAQCYAWLREASSTAAWQAFANQTAKQRLIDRVEALAASDDYPTILATVREARQQWKEIGPVDRHQAAALWQRFDAACTTQYQRCQPWLAAEKERRNAVLAEKKELLAASRQVVASEEGWRRKANQLKKIQQRWKALGPLPLERDRRLNKEHQALCRAFFKEYKQFLAEERAGQEVHLRAKEELCRRAEELAADPGWQHRRAMAELQREWKKAGPVFGPDGDAVWQRFRAAGDRFYGWLDEQRQANRQRCLDLIAHLEAVVDKAADADDLRPLMEEVEAIQEEWRNVGEVPRGERDQLWRQFKALLDTFHDQRRQHRQALEAQRRTHSETKRAILTEMEGLLAAGSKDPEAASRFAELEQRFRRTPRGRQAEEKQLQQRYRQLADAFFGRAPAPSQEDHQRQERLLKEKERILFELERLVGVAAPRPRQGLSLAEQLKLALEGNTMLAGVDGRNRADEIRRLERRWAKLPPLASLVEGQLQDRFHRAMDHWRENQKPGS